MGTRPRSGANKQPLPQPDYQVLYEQAKADLELCMELLQYKTHQFKQADKQADAVTKELLARFAKA
jgi:hypothetical protein